MKDLTPSIAAITHAGDVEGKLTQPRLTIAKEKKALRDVMKRLIRKTEKGSIAKVRRRHPGTASLHDTSSESSGSSHGGGPRGDGSRGGSLNKKLNLKKTLGKETNSDVTVTESMNDAESNWPPCQILQHNLR